MKIPTKTMWAAGLSTLVVVLALLGKAYADPLLNRYPGAYRLKPDHLDLSRLRQGWIEHQAIYHTGAEAFAVGRWYLILLAPEAESGIHAAADCTWLRSVRTWLWIQRTVEVLICPALYGTRITIHETLFVRLG